MVTGEQEHSNQGTSFFALTCCETTEATSERSKKLVVRNDFIVRVNTENLCLGPIRRWCDEVVRGIGYVGTQNLDVIGLTKMSRSDILERSNRYAQFLTPMTTAGGRFTLRRLLIHIHHSTP
jgi:hypothetical protein